VRYIVGDGLVVVEEDAHKFLRKNAKPAFCFRHIKELYPMMWAKSVVLATKLREESLRLFPTVPLTLHEALGDITLGPHAIPTGTELVASI
jgi:cytochrome P450